MDYTNLSNQVVFLRDADIVNDMSAKTISGNIVLSNGIPSFDLFTLKRNETNADINFLSNELSTSIRRDLSSVRYFGTVHLSDRYDHEEIAQLTGNTLFGLLKTNMYINKPDKELRAGFTFRAIGNDISDFIVSSDNATSTCILHDNDYIIINKNVEQLSNISINDIDLIKDYDLSISRLQKYANDSIESLSNNLSNTVKLHELSSTELSTVEEIADYYDIKWNVDDIIVVKKRFGEDEKLSTLFEHTGYVYDGENWRAMDGNYSANNVYFKDNIQLAGDYTQVGNIKLANGVLSSKGKSVTTVFSDIFDTTIQPILSSAPTTTCTLNSGTYEVGYPITPTWSVALNQGKYELPWHKDSTGKNVLINDGTSEKAYHVSDNAGHSSTNKSGTFNALTVLDSTSYRITATIDYNDGNIAKDNKGNDSNPIVQRKAGTTATAYSGYISNYRKPFWGYKMHNVTQLDFDNLTSDDIRGLGNSGSSTAGLPTEFNVPAGAKLIVFAAKAGTKNSMTAIDKNAMSSPVTFQQKKSAVLVKGYNNYDSKTAYDVWYCDLESSTGAPKLMILAITWA